MADVVDIGHRLFALSKTEFRHRKMIGVLQFGQMRPHIGPQVGVSARPLRQDASILKVAHADVIGRQCQESPVGLFDV